MAKTNNLEILEPKIEKAQEDVVKAKKKYDTAIAELKRLLDKKQMFRTEEVMTAIAKSKRRYEDIMSFLISENDAAHEE